MPCASVCESSRGECRCSWQSILYACPLGLLGSYTCKLTWCVTALQEQEQAHLTEDAEPNEGCTNEPGNVQDAWGVIVTLLLGLHAHDGKTQ